MTQIPEGFPLPAEKDIRRRYGLALDQYVALAQLQEWVCAICGGPPRPGRPLVVDHDHDGLTVDGLVHLTPCNRRLHQSVRRYLADPPGRQLGLKVPEELEAKTVARREAAKATARANRATERATRARPAVPTEPGLARMRAMTRPEPAQVAQAGPAQDGATFADRVHAALEATGAGHVQAWTGGPVHVPRQERMPDPPPEPEPRRSRRRFRLGGRILSGG